MSVSRYRFFAHFNRVNMQRGLRTVWTVHFRGQCIPAQEVVFKTALTTRYRAEARQPRAILCGRAKTVTVMHGIATVS